MSGLSAEYILRSAIKALSQGKPAHCGDGPTADMRRAQSELDNLRFASGYAEPGYTDPARGVLLANWNPFPKRTADVLERAGYAIEWSDEWAECDDCQKTVRTSPDSYEWRQSWYWSSECTITCADCVRTDLDAYETHCIESEGKWADTFGIDWESRGWTKINPEPYESGLYPGQTDDPETIRAGVYELFDVIFAIPSVGQFDVRFDCYIRPKQSYADDLLNSLGTFDSPFYEFFYTKE